MMAVTIRPAHADDVPHIQSIYSHYVLHTVTSFLIKEPPTDYIMSRFEASRDRGLPYLVAEQKADLKITGYAYASPFRGFMLGYGHSVEVTIFVHPEHVRQGVGSSLMRGLLGLLKDARHHSREVGHEDQPRDFEIKQVLAVMSVDDEREDKGLGLRDWYGKWGFGEVGRLKGIGYKDGRWLDTIYLQRAL